MIETMHIEYEENNKRPENRNSHAFQQNSEPTKTMEQHRGLGIEGVLDKVLEVHGVAPTKKGKGKTQSKWVLMQAATISNKPISNYKGPETPTYVKSRAAT